MTSGGLPAAQLVALQLLHPPRCHQRVGGSGHWVFVDAEPWGKEAQLVITGGTHQLGSSTHQRLHQHQAIPIGPLELWRGVLHRRQGCFRCQQRHPIAQG